MRYTLYGRMMPKNSADETLVVTSVLVIHFDACILGTNYIEESKISLTLFL